MPTRSSSRIELLESRIAPASLSAGVLKYTDLDGDLVQITFSAGASLTLNNFTFDTAGAKQQLQTIDLHGLTALEGGSITEKVTHVAGGDGLAAIGYINAAGVDLGKVKIAGDLGRIDAGADAATSVAIKSLDVKSMGFFGTATQAAGGTLSSAIKGSIVSLTVGADLSGAQLILTDTAAAADAKIGPVHIGGNVTGAKIQVAGGLGLVTVGGTVSGSGFVADGAIAGISITHDLTSSAQVKGGSLGPVKIGGLLDQATIDGGTGITGVTIGSNMDDGAITSGGTIGTVKVAGSLASTAKISAAGDLTSITIKGHVKDSSTIESTGGRLVSATFGTIDSAALTGHNGIGSLTIKGELATASITTAVGGITSLTVGGRLDASNITVAAACGSLKVGGDLVYCSLTAASFGAITAGGSTSGSDIQAKAGNITSLKTGGSFTNTVVLLTAGALGPFTVGQDFTDSAIKGASIGPVKIALSLASSTLQSTTGDITSVQIGSSLDSGTVTAAGHLGPITVGRDLTFSDLAGKSIGIVKIGGDMFASAITSDTDLASVTIKGSVSMSDILAGATGTPASATIGKIDVGGNWLASDLSAGVKATNNKYGNTTDTVLSATSSIASIVIKGVLAGTADANDHFGFDARKIGSFSLGGFAVPLSTTPGATPLSPATGDVNVVTFA